MALYLLFMYKYPFSFFVFPREGPGGLSRKYVLRIPSLSKKATNWGGVSESPYKKVGPVSVLGRAR